MRISVLTLVLLLGAAVGLCACVPDVVGIEAVPPPKLARDLKQCEAATGSDGMSLGNEMKRCMKAKGHQFLRTY
jgi:hypothetical protein